MLRGMLDIRLLREKPEEIRELLGRRGPGAADSLDRVLELDARRRSALTRLQALQASRNKLSKEIGRLKASGADSSALEAQVRSDAAEMAKLEEDSRSLAAEQEALLLLIPNTPLPDVPCGSSSADNPVRRTWGEPPQGPPPPAHTDIATELGLVDFERAAKLAGAGFACFMGAGARLERALIHFMLDLHTREQGYTEVSPPIVVRRECMVGTGQLPKFEEDMYAVEAGGLFLAPTAEVPVTNLHREEILENLPLRYVAYTPCFRREAGAAGRESRGLIRMHQFDKVELVKICRPEDSAAELESLTADAERVLQRLGLHYRVVELCTGDLGFSAARTYDLEVWAPGQQSWLEVSSCSNFGDYQARRMNLRWRAEDGKPRLAHTLNGSGTALPRLVVALLETGWRGGRVVLPEPLQPYFGAAEITA